MSSAELNLEGGELEQHMMSNQQIQQQIQAIRQDLQNISQVASQLQQAEQSNRVQLQNLQQNEAMAFQQLQQLQQVIGHVSQGINQINSLAVQATQTQTGLQYGTGWGTYGTGQPGAFWQGAQGGIAGQFSQPGSFASGVGTSPYGLSGTYTQGMTAGNQYGQTGWGGTQTGSNLYGGGQLAHGTWGGNYSGANQFGAGQTTLGGMTGQGYGSFSAGMIQPFRNQFEIGQLGSSGQQQYSSSAQGGMSSMSGTSGLGASAGQSGGPMSVGGSYNGQSGAYTSQVSAGKMS